MGTGAYSDDATPPWCRRLITELNDSDQRATALAKNLTSQQLNWTPSAGAWSVGQCLEHLCITNHVYLEPISSALVGGRLGSVDEITPGWFGRWFIRNYIEPSSTGRRSPAPKKIKPPSNADPSILRRFLTSNDRARELVRSAASHDVNRIRFRNPFVGVVRFTVGTGFEILSKHQRRHLLQAERVKASPKFPQAISS
jgi:hypothetical protein